MGVHILAHLAVVGRELDCGTPVGGLRVGLGDEEVGVLERAREIGLNRLLRAVEVILRAVVDVVGGNVEGGSDGLFVDVVVHHAAVVGGDELAGAGALADEGRLPMEKVGNAHLAPARPLKFVAGALRAVAGGQVFPCVQILAPVVEEPGLAERFGRDEFLFEIVLEADEDVGIGGFVAGGFVVDLPADDVWVVFVVGNDVADEALGIEAVGRRIGVHVLAHAVGVLDGGPPKVPPFMRWARISGCWWAIHAGME